MADKIVITRLDVLHAVSKAIRSIDPHAEGYDDDEIKTIGEEVADFVGLAEGYCPRCFFKTTVCNCNELGTHLDSYEPTEPIDFMYALVWVLLSRDGLDVGGLTSTLVENLPIK